MNAVHSCLVNLLFPCFFLSLNPLLQSPAPSRAPLAWAKPPPVVSPSVAVPQPPPRNTPVPDAAAATRPLPSSAAAVNPKPSYSSYSCC